MRRLVLFVSIIVLLLGFSLAAESNTESNFIVAGCELPDGTGITDDTCSRDGRYYCDGRGLGVSVLLDTVLDSGGCSQGLGTFALGSQQCCPAGYECQSQGGTGPKCALKQNNACINLNNNEGGCIAASCFFLPDSPSSTEGICVERPGDYSCGVYNDPALCTQDPWNLGKSGIKSDACDGKFVTDVTGKGFVVPQSSCECTWNRNECKLKYNAIQDIYGVSATPTTHICLIDFEEASECRGGQQRVNWSAESTSTEQAFNTAIECTEDSVIRNCGYETIKLPGFSLFSLVFSLVIILMFYLYPLRRNDL